MNKVSFFQTPQAQLSSTQWAEKPKQSEPPPFSVLHAANIGQSPRAHERAMEAKAALRAAVVELQARMTTDIRQIDGVRGLDATVGCDGVPTVNAYAPPHALYDRAAIRSELQQLLFGLGFEDVKVSVWAYEPPPGTELPPPGQRPFEPQQFLSDLRKAIAEIQSRMTTDIRAIDAVDGVSLVPIDSEPGFGVMVHAPALADPNPGYTAEGVRREMEQLLTRLGFDVPIYGITTEPSQPNWEQVLTDVRAAVAEIQSRSTTDIRDIDAVERVDVVPNDGPGFGLEIYAPALSRPNPGYTAEGVRREMEELLTRLGFDVPIYSIYNQPAEPLNPEQFLNTLREAVAEIQSRLTTDIRDIDAVESMELVEVDDGLGFVLMVHAPSLAGPNPGYTAEGIKEEVELLMAELGLAPVPVFVGAGIAPFDP
ncbi:hypothetical protein ACFL6C_03590 [Myxococcota bacterium]